MQASEANYTNVNYGLVPLNEDGSIDVKLSEETVNAIKPPETMNVNVMEIGGEFLGCVQINNGLTYAIATYQVN